MRWDEIDHNEKLWTLARERTKADRAHSVPLSDLALELISSCPRIGDYVLTTRGDRPVSGFAKWKKQLDEKMQALLSDEAKAGSTQTVSLPPWRLHDLRRTVATHMEEIGVPPHTVASVLNHSPKGFKGITSVYTRGDLIYARRKALVAWARYLSLLLDDRIAKTLQRLLNPESEIDAQATDSFRQLLLEDVTTWERRRDSMFRLTAN